METSEQDFSDLEPDVGVRTKKRSSSTSRRRKNPPSIRLSSAESIATDEERPNNNQEYQLRDTGSSRSNSYSNNALRQSKTARPATTSFETSSHTSEPEHYTYESRFADSTLLKTKGNTLFKEKRFQEAIAQYTSGLKIVDSIHFKQAPRNVLAKMNEFQIVFLLNVSSCYYNMGKFETAEKYSSEVLKISKSNFKAFYRKALCLYELGRYEQALESVKQAHYIDPTSQELAESYKKILNACKEAREKQLRLKQQEEAQKALITEESIKHRKKRDKHAARNPKPVEDSTSKSGFHYLVCFGGIALTLGLVQKLELPEDEKKLILATGLTSSTLMGFDSGFSRVLGVGALITGAVAWNYHLFK